MTAMYWTTTEIQVLLEVTLQYKEEKSRQNIDWRSHTSTYHDIWKAFLQVYPVKRAEEGVWQFPHDVEKINKAKIIFKLKDMRRRFHKNNFLHRFQLISERIWGEEEEEEEDEEDEDEDGEDSDVMVEEEEDYEVEEDSKDTKAALESESCDWSSTESEDCKDTKAALESESCDWSSTESEDCKDTKAALESESSDSSSTESEDCKDTKAAVESESSDSSSTESEDCKDTKAALVSESSDWSSTESEHETETFKPPRLFEDDAYYAQLDRCSRESAERSRLERVKKHTEQLLDLLVRSGLHLKI